MVLTCRSTSFAASRADCSMPSAEDRPMDALPQELPGIVRPIEGLDVEALRNAIREEYDAVARQPDRGFHFHTGRPLARLLGYADEWLEGIPEPSVASLAGTGNPF